MFNNNGNRMRDVFIVGEDDATRAVIKRLIEDYNPNLNILQNIPARGSEIKSKIKEFNKLAQIYPVILLVDLDGDPCAPIGKRKLLDGIIQSQHFIVNIAYDEVEAWLMADTKGFASYFGISINNMPQFLMQKMQGLKSLSEIFCDVNVKSSWHLTHELAHLSSKSDIKAQISVPKGEKTCKGKEYNTVIVPYIEKFWHPEVARQVSDSLNRMIVRIQKL